MRIHSSVVVLAALVMLAACSSNRQPQPSSEQKSQQTAPKQVETQTGREAFQRLYVAARAWAGDIKPFRVQSEPVTDANGQGGKAAVWRASFASPSRRAIKTYLWSGAGEAGQRGVTSGSEDNYNPNNNSTQVFDVAFLKIDTDKAYDVAQQHGGEKLTRKDPTQPISYVLDWDARHNKLIWHVNYGSSPSDTRLRVAVDATTGSFLQ